MNNVVDVKDRESEPTLLNLNAVDEVRVVEEVNPVGSVLKYTEVTLRSGIKIQLHSDCFDYLRQMLRN